MKKIISLFLVLVTILSVSATAVFAEDATVKGKCGDNITYTYNEKTGTLIIEGTGKMYDYSTDKHEQPECFKAAKNLVISDGVTTVGKEAFFDCNYLVDVTIGKDVKTIGKRAFMLTDVLIYNEALSANEGLENRRYYVPENVTKIGKEAFGCMIHYDNGNYVEPRSNWVVVGEPGSAAFEYCQKTAVSFDDADGCANGEHIWGNTQCVKEKVCNKTDGIDSKQCIKCGTRRYEKRLANNGHDFAKETTKTVKKATYFEKGTEKTYCTTCKKYISYKTDKLSIPAPAVKLKKGKKQVTFTFNNTKEEKKHITGYRVKVFKYNEEGKPEKVKTYNTKKDKLTINNFKKNTDYKFEIYTVYEKNGKTATRGILRYAEF